MRSRPYRKPQRRSSWRSRNPWNRLHITSGLAGWNAPTGIRVLWTCSRRDRSHACLYPVTHLMALPGGSLVRVCRTGEGVVVERGQGAPPGSRTFFRPGHLLSMASTGRDLLLARADGHIRLYSRGSRRVARTFGPVSDGATGLAAEGDVVVAAQGHVLRAWHRGHGQPAGAPVRLPGRPVWLSLQRSRLRVLLADGRMLTYQVSLRKGT